MPRYTFVFRDINGETSNTKIYQNTDLNAAATAQDLADCSNAQVVGVYGTFPFVWTQLRPVGLANNVETAKTRAVLVFSGTDLGNPDNPNPEAFIKVPAPLGGIIEPGNVLGAAGITLRDAIIGKLKNNSGVTMDTFERCYYE